MKKTALAFFWLLCLTIPALAAYQPRFSTAGFYELQGSGRKAYNMNAGWRFYRGAAPGAQEIGYDDSRWEAASLPKGVELLPTEASGCVNYQGEAWFRKHFTTPDTLQGKRLFLHFEGIMGKSRIYVDGKLLKEHFGGFLPAIVDVTDALKPGKKHVLAVWADNSDDPSYPPGKPQDVLDFSYFGGIYRDCWLVSHAQQHITDPNYENEVAGGGLLVAFDKVSEASAQVLLKLHLRNQERKSFSGKVQYTLVDAQGKAVASAQQSVRLSAGKAAHFAQKLQVANPALWSPDSPELYHLQVRLLNAKGQVVDGYQRRIGIRSIAFKGKDGFWLNGKPYPYPLIGANRHQDFAVVGNAVSNSLHWRDAKKLRDAGLRVIRNAHYPQDPSFMDACDELGLFVIVNTPGWQFWNEAPIFEQRVYANVRDMVRRDRNNPSVLLWEPILNETWYPGHFAKNVHDFVKQEFPYPSCYTACDHEARGKEHFDVQFTHPSNGDAAWAIKHKDDSKTYFTREWGDNVDDWNSHNSPSRVNTAWGEHAMLRQAQHYAHPPYAYTSYDALYRTDRQHFGGALWHSFDHQRGYHPDPFYGGLMDVFRQPKYSYYMFMAQRPAEKNEKLLSETGPMVYIAHEMTPFSDSTVHVYSNCEEVRLTYIQGGKTHVYKRPVSKQGMPSPIIAFEGVYGFMEDKVRAMNGKHSEVFMKAEGLIDGKVVATHERRPARRPSKLLLWLDDEGTGLQADGSDLVTVVAAMADGNGEIKRLSNHFVRFEVEGEGRLMGDASQYATERPLNWGVAPVLLQSTTKAGPIKVRVSMQFPGKTMPVSAELEISSKPTEASMIFTPEELLATGDQPTQSAQQGDAPALQRELEKVRAELNAYKLKEVEQQQKDFGEKRD